MSFETVANHRTHADYARPIHLSNFDAVKVALKDINSPPYSKVQLVASAMPWAGYTISGCPSSW